MEIADIKDGIYIVINDNFIVDYENVSFLKDKHGRIYPKQNHVFSSILLIVGDNMINISLKEMGNKHHLLKKRTLLKGIKPHITLAEALQETDGLLDSEKITMNLNPTTQQYPSYPRQNGIRYIPSLSEMYLILIYRKQINEALSMVEGDVLTEDFYWTSTPYNGKLFWSINLKNGCASAYNANELEAKVRFLYFNSVWANIMKSKYLNGHGKEKI